MKISTINDPFCAGWPADATYEHAGMQRPAVSAEDVDRQAVAVASDPPSTRRCKRRRY